MANDITSSTTSSSITPVSASSAVDKANASSTSIAKNMDTFLKLLTTQLRHQSPLDPLDSNKFTEQLVQFASVEQQINQNKTLASILAAVQTQQTNSAMGYLGNQVNYDASKSSSADGTGVKWSFNVAASDTYTLRIKDAGGNVVREEQAAFKGGELANFNWTSGRSDNRPVGNGVYTLEVYRGTGATTSPVKVEGSGLVSAIDTVDGQNYLQINGQRVLASSVSRVEIPK